MQFINQAANEPCISFYFQLGYLDKAGTLVPFPKNDPLTLNEELPSILVRCLKDSHTFSNDVRQLSDMSVHSISVTVLLSYVLHITTCTCKHNAGTMQTLHVHVICSYYYLGVTVRCYKVFTRLKPLDQGLTKPFMMLLFT